MSTWDSIYLIDNDNNQYESDSNNIINNHVHSDYLVSVVCMSYNHSEYIERAIQGLVNQKTSFNYEIIIHDDASTDNTQQIICSYKSQYPSLIHTILQTENQMSKGVKILRDIVFPKIQGKYIAFCEGDDYWCDDEKLQLQVDIMEKNPSVSLCVAKTQYLDCFGSVLPKKIVPERRFSFVGGIIPKDQYLKQIWINQAYFHTSSYLIRRDFLCWIYMNSSMYKINGDQIWLRLAPFGGDVFFLDRIVSCRRILTSNSWNKWFADASEEKKAKYWLNEAESFANIDILTDRIFHNYAVVPIFKRLKASIAFDVDRVIRITKACSAKLSDFKQFGAYEDRLAFLAIRYCPHLYRKFKKSKDNH